MDWDALYADPKFCLREPADEVVRFVPLLRAINADRVLDLGFGAGRHIIYLAKLGFRMYGTDISPRGEEITRQWLREEGLTAALSQSDMTHIPYYPGNFFDACVCRGVITHNTSAGIRRTIAEMYRALRPGGLVMCTFISRESSEYGKGKEIEPHTFEPMEGIETGVPHHFMDEQETRAWMGEFFHEVDLYHMKHAGLVDVGTPYVSAHWVYIGRK